MTDAGHTLKTLGDAVASMTGFVTVLSTWAGLLTPILSLLVLIATLGWWVIRYAEWWSGPKLGDDQ